MHVSICKTRGYSLKITQTLSLQLVKTTMCASKFGLFLLLTSWRRNVIKCNTDTAVSWENVRRMCHPRDWVPCPHLRLSGLAMCHARKTNTPIYLRQWLSEPGHLCAVAFAVILLSNHLLQLLFLDSYAVKGGLQKRMHWAGGRKVGKKH